MEKFKKIKALLFDVDGVMTNGGISYDAEGREIKTFSVRDGQICNALKKNGFKLGVITGRKSTIVEKRFTELGFDFIQQGISNKRKAMEVFIQESGLTWDEIAFTGDDINDLCVFEKVGLSACPQDAQDYIRKSVDYVVPVNGGEGVLRGLADEILKAQGLLESILEEYRNL